MTPGQSQSLQGIEHLFGVSIGLVAIAVAAFLVTSWLTHLQARLRDGRDALQTTAAWLPLLQIGIWIGAAVTSFAIVLRAPDVVIFAVLVPTLGALVLASRDLVRNAIAGAVLAFEHSILAGDLIDVATPTGEVCGQVVAIGLRRTLLRRPDGSDVLVPNQTLLNSTVRTNRGHELDSAVEIQLALDEEFNTAEFPRVSEIARAAASVSRFASPHRRPAVFLDASDDGQYRVTVQAYAFAPDYVRHLRTDVVSLFNEGLEDS